MEFKINFAFIVCIFFVVIFTISLIDEIVKAIRNKRKNKVRDMAFDSYASYLWRTKMDFLIKEHNFTAEQLIDKCSDELCEECAHKLSCANGFAPKCLVIDEEMLNKIYLSKIDSD